MKTETENVCEIEVSKTVKETKEISLPAFFKSTRFFIKLFSKEKCLVVERGESIGLSPSSLPFLLTEAKRCTEEEFYEAYIETADFIKGIII